jgi:hypothetical protein
MAKAVELARYGCLHPWVEVTRVEHGDAPGEVHVATAFHIPEFGVAGPIYINREGGADSTRNRFEAPAMKIGVGGHRILPGSDVRW